MVLSRPRFIVSFAQSDLNRSETLKFLGFRSGVRLGMGNCQQAKCDDTDKFFSDSKVIQLF